MQRTLRTSLLVLGLAVIALAPLSHSSAADFSAVWDGGNGNWGDPLHWNTNPNYPNNTGGITYDATINSGTITLDRDITLQRLFLSGNAGQGIGTLTGAFQVTLNEGLSWTGGTIGATTINLASGSISNISGGNAFTHILHGTINNAGTVNQTTYIRYFDGVINNSAGAVWNFDAFGINTTGGMFSVPPDGQFNNAGSLLVAGNSFFGGTKQFNTTLNNSGIVTLQSPASGVSSIYVYKGSATGAFNVASQAELQFGNYSLATGATISGAGVTNIKGTLDIIGNATISSSLVNSATLLVESGATLTLNGLFTQGPVSSSSTLATTRLNGGTIASSQTLGFAHGILTGRGTINANVNLFGSTLLSQLGGTSVGGGNNNYDLIGVNGTTALGGMLGVFFKNGFETSVSASDAFTLFTSSSGFTGAFDNAANGARVDTGDYLGTFLVTYGGTGITLSNFVPNTRWLGGNGNWTDAIHWQSNPLYPNDTPTTHYSALIRDGSVFLDTNITVSRFLLTGGNLTCGSTLTVTNGLAWTGGTISGGGTVLAAGSVSTISRPLDGSVTSRKLISGVLNNYGTVNQTGEITAMGQNAVNNMAGANWNIDATQVQSFVSDSDILFNNLGNLTIKGPVDNFGVLYNNGSIVVQEGSRLSVSNGGSGNGSFDVGTGGSITFGGGFSSQIYTFTPGAKVTGAGTANITQVNVSGDMAINSIVFNNGNVTIQPGITLTLGGPFTQGTGGTTGTYLRSATLTSAQLLNFEAGKLMGSGTINGNVSVGSNAPNVFTNSVVTPGDQANAIGTFTVNGSFSLLNTAKIVMDISGGISPTNDFLALAGSALLDGILELHVSAAQFNPKQTLTLLTSSDLAGVFDNVANGERLTSADGTTSFRVNYGAGSPYGANDLVLSDPQAVPEPASLTLFAGGIALLGLLGFRKR